MITRHKDMHAFNFDQELKQIMIQPPREFSFAETLHYLRRSPAECMHLVEDEKLYKLLQFEEKTMIIEISENEEDTIQIDFVKDAPDSAKTYQQVADYIVEWFDLRTDLNPFYEMAEEDPLLSELVHKYSGLRVIGVPDLFEAFCWSVIGQQVNLPFAYTVKRRFVEAYGKSVEWNERLFWKFPDPKTITSVSVEDLKKLQFTGRKAEYIIGIAELIANGHLDKQSLLEDFQQAEKTLLAIRGIGPWSAHYVMMRCLRDRSAFPIGDAGLQNALKKRLGRQTKPAPEEIRELFSRWENWEAYAVFYLWRSLSD
ncbi:DNA-3-methyladenine glycosylase 2 [Alkalihalobacillus sp. TS-13]|uniref:DNA-3-methyladenine glycosylase 2 n=1 Tax=Alkalihalobacillus sp. TS-13 TaxID=2842455 RepID=UPI001C880E8B|nr:DNA-3-methyladenine glycosylase 2 [Alkalihalobacillus sp. TS-13]